MGIEEEPGRHEHGVQPPLSEDNPATKVRYPKVGDIDFEKEPTPFGDPYIETVNHVTDRVEMGEEVVDFGGAEGRNAKILSLFGYNILVFDMHRAPLKALEKQAKLLKISDRITTAQGDLDDEKPFENIEDMENRFMCSIMAGILYIYEPEAAEEIFNKTLVTVKPGGLAVVEFNTDIIRLDEEGESLDGEQEYKYELSEGYGFLRSMFKKAKIEDVRFDEKAVEHTKRGFMSANVIIASGIYTP